MYQHSCIEMDYNEQLKHIDEVRLEISSYFHRDFKARDRILLMKRVWYSKVRNMASYEATSESSEIRRELKTEIGIQ